MTTSKTFECENCGAEGKIVVKSDDFSLSDIIYCPVCGSDIFEDEDDD